MTISTYVEAELPYDLHAEAAVLGAILIDPSCIPEVLDVLTPDDFHRARNRFCYEAVIEVHLAGAAVDQITVARRLAQRQLLDETGGLPYLGQLIAETPTSVNVLHYAAIVLEAANKRRLIAAGNHIARLGFDDGPTFDDGLRQAMQAISQIANSRRRHGLRRLRDELDTFLQNPDGTPEDNSNMVPTGYPSLDSILTAFQPGDLIVLGARPSMGKTSLALNFTTTAASASQTACIFSMEMASAQIMLRLVAAHSGISAHRLRTGLYTEEEETDMVNSVGALSGQPIWIDDNGSSSVAEIRQQLEQIYVSDPPRLVVVDYLQLIRPAESRYRNNVQDMTEISRSLKELAVSMHVPIIACSQLSRAPELRADHHPILSDLRESGSIEQDADVVMLLYRPDRYYTVEQWQQLHPGSPYPLNRAELNVAKHRNGPTGSVNLFFNPHTMTFYQDDQPTLGQAI